LSTQTCQDSTDSTESEAATLGIVQHWPNTIHQMHELTVDDFHKHKHKLLWSTLTKMVAQRQDIGDRILLMDQLKQDGNFDAIGGPIGLSDICAIPANSGNIVNYISELKKKTAELNAVAACEQFKRDLGTSDSHEAIERLKNDLNDSSYISKKLAGRTMKELAYNALEETFSDDADTFETNYFQLDNALGGQLGRTSFTVIAAGPSFGKTALALNIMQNGTRNGKPIRCLYVGMEMTETEIFDRFIAADGEIPGHIVRKIRRNTSDSESRIRYGKSFAESVTNISGRGHIIKSDGIISINEFRALVAMYSKDIDCAILDYIQQLRPTDPKQGDMEKVNEASWACKDLAMTYNIPIIGLSQLNRDGYKDGCKPTLANLRASGQIEQDANNVWIMWRAKEDGATEEEMELFIAKNRNGPVCRIGLNFNLKHGRIENLKPIKNN